MENGKSMKAQRSPYPGSMEVNRNSTPEGAEEVLSLPLGTHADDGSLCHISVLHDLVPFCAEQNTTVV